MLLGEFLHQRAVSACFAIAFACVVGSSEALFSCAGLLPITARYPFLSSPVIFLAAICGFVLSCVATTVVSGAVARPCLVLSWVLYLAINIVGTKQLFFHDYDLLLLEVGLCAILFSGPVGRLMSGWVLFRFLYGHALGFLACANSRWWDLTWFQTAFTTAEHTPFSWFLYEAPLPAVRVLTSFVLGTFLLSGLIIYLLPQQAPRYLFWAPVVYFAIAQQSAWTLVLIFALTSYLQSDHAVLQTYSSSMLTYLGARIPAQVTKDGFPVSTLLGWFIFFIIPILAAAELINLTLFAGVKEKDAALGLIGAAVFAIHIILLLVQAARSQLFGVLLALPVSFLGLIKLFPSYIEVPFDLALIKMFPSYIEVPFDLGLIKMFPSYIEVPFDVPFSYGEVLQCPRGKAGAETLKNALIFGVKSEITPRSSRDHDMLLLKHDGYNDDYSMRQPVRFPFAARAERALADLASSGVTSGDAPEWLVRLMERSFYRDETMAQLFTRGEDFVYPNNIVNKYFGPSERAEKIQKGAIEFIYARSVTLRPSTGRTNHRWWNEVSYKDLFMVNHTSPSASCPPPQPWVAFPLAEAGVAILLLLLLIRLIGGALTADKTKKDKKA